MIKESQSIIEASLFGLNREFERLYDGYIHVWWRKGKLMVKNSHFSEKKIAREFQNLYSTTKVFSILMRKLFSKNFAEKVEQKIQDGNLKAISYVWSASFLPPHPLADDFPKNLVFKEGKKHSSDAISPLQRKYEINFVKVNDENFFVLFSEKTYDARLKMAWEKDHELITRFFEMNPYGISLYDADGHYIIGNDSYRELHGTEAPPEYCLFDDPLGKEFAFYSKYCKAAEEGQVFYVPDMWYDASYVAEGTPSKLHCQRTVMVPIKADNPIHDIYIQLHEDITDQKKAELKLKELKAELEKRVKQRTISLEKSESKYRKAYKRANCFKGLFTHDIHNMFNSISNALEYAEIMIRNKSFTPKILDYFELVKKQIRRGKKLIKNIQKLSEIEKSEMKIRPLSLRHSLVSAIDFVRNIYHDRSLDIILPPKDLLNDEDTIMANKLVVDVFENVLINAIKFNKSPKAIIEIEIETIEEEDLDYMQIKFVDNGEGIPDDRKQSIFKSRKSDGEEKLDTKHKQISQLKGPPQTDLKPKNQKNSNIGETKTGLGIGLFTISQLISLCEGKIWVEDKVPCDCSQGSIFIIQLREGPPKITSTRPPVKSLET